MTTRRLRLPIATLALALLSGCAAAMAPTGGSGLAVRGRRAVVRVEGRGTVTSSDRIACGARGTRCEAEWDDLATPRLTATPEPGWVFDRWQWVDERPSLAPGAIDDSHVYTAVFVARPRTAAAAE